MSQLWAIVEASGSYVLRYTGGLEMVPADSGHRKECRGRNVWPLEREPLDRSGEVVDFVTGDIVYSSEKAVAAIVPHIKAWTQAQILTAVPYWRQLNDLAEPEADGAADRRKSISDLRNLSNELEQKVRDATSSSEVEAIWQRITRG